MNPTALRLPPRAAKPRQTGLTMVIDGGIGVAHFADLISSAAAPPHRGDEPGEPASLYPRHFGVTFRAEADFEALHACAVLRKIPFYQEVSTRFEGLVEEHHTFVLLDPSGNLLEFKHYRDPRMMY